MAEDGLGHLLVQSAVPICTLSQYQQIFPSRRERPNMPACVLQAMSCQAMSDKHIWAGVCCRCENARSHASQMHMVQIGSQCVRVRIFT